MTKTIFKKLISIIFLSFLGNTYADENFPTLCTKNEYTYISALMAKKSEKLFVKNGKILSICVDQEKEPFNKMTYKYGTLDNIELKVVATQKQPFEVTTYDLDPHSGENIIAFSNNQYKYYIIQYIGMGSGIALKIYKNHKKILDLFSGNDKEKDYFTNDELYIEFDKPKSLILKNVMPIDNIDEFN